MANTSVVYARIDTELKEKAEEILSRLGISPTSAIHMLYSQIVMHRGMPFDLRLPVDAPAEPAVEAQPPVQKAVPPAAPKPVEAHRDIAGMTREELYRELSKGAGANRA